MTAGRTCSRPASAGTKSNRLAMAARVKVIAKGMTQSDQVHNRCPNRPAGRPCRPTSFAMNRRHHLFFPKIDILPGLKSGDSYGLHAYAWIPSVGSCHDALTACEGCEQASEANPASRIFTALMKSALADSPHWTHANLACVLRLSADTRPHPPKDTGQVRLVFCGGTGYNRPPLHSVLYSS